MLKVFLRRALAAAGLSLALAGPSPARTVQPARPALWAVSDPDTTIYLFGTIHLLPEKYQWRTAKFDQALVGSQQLVVETIVDNKNPAKLMGALASLAFNTPNLPPLAERVPPAKRAALAAAIRKSGFPPQALDKMETWAAAITLLGNQYKDMGLKGDEGVEAVLRNTFISDGKPIGELESNVEQLGFFDKLPESAQRQLLEGSIDDSKSMTKEFHDMLSAWVRGDVHAIAESFNRDLSASPELQEALIKQRNANWSRWIKQRMAQPGAIMIAVGAGHLAGRDSVIDLLQRDGAKPPPVSSTRPPRITFATERVLRISSSGFRSNSTNPPPSPAQRSPAGSPRAQFSRYSASRTSAPPPAATPTRPAAPAPGAARTPGIRTAPANPSRRVA